MKKPLLRQRPQSQYDFSFGFFLAALTTLDPLNRWWRNTRFQGKLRLTGPESCPKLPYVMMS
jgi:hypothetical protein